jgi:hypothetical protein
MRDNDNEAFFCRMRAKVSDCAGKSQESDRTIALRIAANRQR